MAGSAFGLPEVLSIYDPSIAVDQTALQRQMALAQALRTQAMTPIDTNGRQIGGMGYRVSPLEGVAKVVQAMQAGRMENQTDTERQALMQKMAQAYATALRGDSGSTPAPQQAPAPVSDASVPNGGLPAGVTPQAMSAGGFPQPAQGAPQAAPQPVAPPQPAGAAPTGDADRFSMARVLRGSMIEGLGGQAAGNAYWDSSKLPDAAKMLNFTGQNPQVVGDLTTAELRRKALGPQPLGRWGYTTADNQVHGAPSTIDGSVAVPDPNNPSGFRYEQTPGATAAMAASAAATELGKGSAIPGQPLYDNKGNPLPLQSRTAQVTGAPAAAALRNYPPTQVSPAEQLSRDGDRLGILQNELANTTDPNDRALIQKEIDATKGGKAYIASSSPQGGGAYPVQPLGTEGAQKGLDTSWEALKAQNREAKNTSSYLDNIVSAAEKGAIIGPNADRREMIAGFMQLAHINKDENDKALSQTQLLDKYHDQIVTRLGQGGLGTDAARALLDTAYPGKHMNMEAIREAAANLKGAQAMVSAKTSFLLDPAVKRDSTGYQQREIQFDQNADPRIWQWASIQNPDQRKAFLQQTLQQDPSFLNRVQKLKEMGALQ